MINTAVLMGRICHDLELKSTQSGKSILNFTVACERKYQAQGEQRQADFIDCIAWEHTAKFIESYFRKGSMIAIEGRIQTDNYEDKNGNKRKSVVVVAESVSFCGSKSESGGNNNAGTNAKPNLNVAPPDDFEEIEDDTDLPF